MPRALPHDLRDQAQVLYSLGTSPARIAEKLGLSRHVVSKWVTRLGWRRTADSLKQEIDEAAEQLVQKSLRERSEAVRTMLAAEVERQVQLLTASPAKSPRELGNTPAGEGRASVVRRIADSASDVFLWGEQKTSGMILAIDLGQPDVQEQAQIADAPAEPTEQDSSMPQAQDRPAGVSS